MNATKIEWVKNPDGTPGYTWNPLTGCLNHVDGLCKGGNFPCYAYRLANGRLKARYLANDNLARSGYPIPNNLDELPCDEDDPFYPRFWRSRLDEVIDKTWSFSKGYSARPSRTPIGVFTCDMGELFGSWVPHEWQEHIFEAIKSCPRDRFYLLTKQPQNLVQWSPFPANCWVGVTATNQETWDKAIYWLGYHTEARVKYISFEPLLERIRLGVLPFKMINGTRLINWLIIGAQTKPYKPPKIEHVREIVEAADKAGIPVFLKDNLKPALICTRAVQDNRLWRDLRDDRGLEPLHLELRQEMPSEGE